MLISVLSSTGALAGQFNFLKTLRAFRVFRLFKRVKSLNKIVTSLCPGGKERMRRLLNVVASGRVDLGPLVTHQYALADINDAYDLFANQRDGVLKVAIKP